MMRDITSGDSKNYRCSNPKECESHRRMTRANAARIIERGGGVQLKEFYYK